MERKVFGALGTVVIGIAVIAGIGTYVAAAKNDSGITVATPAGTFTAPDGKSYPQVSLNLNVYPNSGFGGHHGAGGGAHPDWVSYALGGPNGEILADATSGTNFQVPPHTAVTITVFQYDSGETLNNDFFAHVRGTVDGTAKFVKSYDTNAKANASPETVITNIPTDMVGHTFTLHGMSDGQDQIFVSVPLMMSIDEEVGAAEEGATESGYVQHPTKTTFTFITGDEGEYIWNCEFPCGDGTIARFGNAMSAMGYMSGHFIVKA
jgi:hypothetical protein